MTKPQWREHIANWRASGLSCRDYAARSGLNHHTLASYASKRYAEPPGPALRSDFVELAPVEPTTPPSIDLQVGAVHIHLPINFDAATLARVLDVLEARR